MPPCVESSVCSQGQVAIKHEEGNERVCNLTRLVGRRRILVQTETGNLYGMEVDRSDNVQAVKKRLQALLHVPMDQVTLICGDLILKNDLSELKRDGPLLLTRKLERSLSSPCLSPTLEFQVERGSSHVLEVVGGLLGSLKMRGIIEEITKAVQCGVEPVLISGGLGGAYYFRNSKGERIAIIKPTDEEPLAPNNPKGFIGRALGQYGLKKTIRVGETGVREVAAYLLDHENFARVPPTVLVKITHHAFHLNSTTSASGKSHSSVTKLASCQEFVCHDFDASDHGCSGFSVSAVHRIGILDIRIFNTDRHAGNILVKKIDTPRKWGNSRMHVNDTLELIPIDHGLCLPEFLEDPYFEWLHWPQASLSFSDEELDYIQRLDGKKDAEMLRAELPMLRVASLRMLILSTTFLKIGAAAGFCLAEIGALMSRDGLEEVSQLEVFCLKARQETETRLLNVMQEEDNYFPDNSYDGDDFQEQFEFEEDEEVHEDTSSKQLLYSQSDYIGPHPVGLSNGSHFQASSLIHNVESEATSDMPHDFSYGNFYRGREFHGKENVSLGNVLIGKSNETHSKLSSEVSSLKREEFTPSLPAKQRTSCTNGWRIMSRAVSILDSSVSSTSKSAGLNCSPENAHQYKVKAGLCQAAESMEAWHTFWLPLKAASYKSASLCDSNQRSNFLVDRRTFGLSSSETHGKANVAGSVSAMFSFEVMTEQEWACFMDCFEQILQRDFATRCTESAGYRQRLGISLPAAFHQMRPR